MFRKIFSSTCEVCPQFLCPWHPCKVWSGDIKNSLSWIGFVKYQVAFFCNKKLWKGPKELGTKLLIQKVNCLSWEPVEKAGRRIVLFASFNLIQWSGLRTRWPFQFIISLFKFCFDVPVSFSNHERSFELAFRQVQELLEGGSLLLGFSFFKCWESLFRVGETSLIENFNCIDLYFGLVYKFLGTCYNRPWAVIINL